MPVGRAAMRVPFTFTVAGSSTVPAKVVGPWSRLERSWFSELTS
jgi:hypothetical protein